MGTVSVKAAGGKTGHAGTNRAESGGTGVGGEAGRTRPRDHKDRPARSAPGRSGAVAVLEAAVRVLVRDGLDGLSVRRVAAEAGVSIGAVQHHFRTKDALLVGAAAHVTTEFQARAAALADEALAASGPVAAFTVFCLLLADALDAAEQPACGESSVVWLWFAAKATQSGPVARAFRDGWSATEDYLRDLLGELFPDLEASIEAAHLLAVLDGLAVARATEPERMPAARAAGIVERHISGLIGRPPTR